MKILLNKLFIISICFLVFYGCKKNNHIETQKANNGAETLYVNDNNEKQNIENNSTGRKIFSNMFPAYILENKVNLRNYPSLKAEIISKLEESDFVNIIGFSGEKEIIDGFEGYWLNVLVPKNQKKGWIFSKYVDIQEQDVSKIKFVELVPAQNGRIPLIKLSYTIDDEEKFVNVYYNTWNNNYVILWNYNEDGFHYSNQPGIYFLDKNTYELKHITYFGTSGDDDEEAPHAWTMFTDDLEYIIQDSGTSPGIRGIKAWRLKDFKEVYSGSYYGREIKGHKILVVYSCDDWAIENGYTDKEIIEYGEKWKKENPIPEKILKDKQETDLSLELIIYCYIDLDTGKREIIQGDYILTQ